MYEHGAQGDCYIRQTDIEHGMCENNKEQRRQNALIAKVKIAFICEIRRSHGTFSAYPVARTFSCARFSHKNEKMCHHTELCAPLHREQRAIHCVHAFCVRSSVLWPLRMRYTLLTEYAMRSHIYLDSFK